MITYYQRVSINMKQCQVPICMSLIEDNPIFQLTTKKQAFFMGVGE
jgi:hypothetical protein